MSEPDRTDLPVEVIEADRPRTIVFFAERRVPVHLVGQAVPSHSAERDAVVAKLKPYHDWVHFEDVIGKHISLVFLEIERISF